MGKLLNTTAEMSVDYELRDNTLISKEREFLTEIGDAEQKSDFYPQVKIKRWDNESNFSIRLQGVGEHKNGTITTDKNKTVWNGTGVRAEFWRLAVVSNSGHPGLEFMVELDSRPLNDEVVFSLSTRGFVFHKQEALTQFDIDRGNERADNVLGSYAVYHSDFTKRGVRRGGQLYKTGKAFHIYRPHITDALSNEIWGELDINTTTNVMTISILSAWLDAATYPIRIDPTIGYAVQGASWDNTGDFSITSRYTSPEAGDANPGTFWHYARRSTAADIPEDVVGVYSDSGGNPNSQPLLSEQAAVVPITDVNPGDWYSVALTWIGIEASTDYHLVVNGQVSPGVSRTNLAYDSSSPGHEDAHFDARQHDDTIEDPAPSSWGALTREHSFYVDYAGLTDPDEAWTPHAQRNYRMSGRYL